MIRETAQIFYMKFFKRLFCKLKNVCRKTQNIGETRYKKYFNMIDVKFGTPAAYGTPVSIKRKESDWPRTIYLSSDATNCKLSYIHGAGGLSDFNEEDLKQIFDSILNAAKGCIILNTTSKKIFEFIKTTYPTYYQEEVPIGYNQGFQYHVCFKNTIRVNANCREPLQAKPMDRAIIKEKLQSVLKAKRRKMDYVDEFINLL